LRVFLTLFSRNEMVDLFALATYRKDTVRAMRAYESDPASLDVWETSAAGSWQPRVYGGGLSMADWIREEHSRQQREQAARRAAGVCLMCGQPLRRMQRLFGTKHKECEEFSD
jgi:hypothetical protein